MAEWSQSQETELQRRLLDSDSSVLETILRAWGGTVLRRLVRKYHGVLTEADIEDVIAIALFRVWQKRFSKNSTGSICGWFARIADHAAQDVLKFGWQKARQLEEYDAQLCERAPPTVDHIDTGETFDFQVGGTNLQSDGTDQPATGDFPKPADVDKSRNQTQAVREIVNSLPEKQRRIIWADASSREQTANSKDLSSELKIPSGTVRVYRKRAMDTIRKEMMKRGFLPQDEVCHGDVS